MYQTLHGVYLGVEIACVNAISATLVAFGTSITSIQRNGLIKVNYTRKTKRHMRHKYRYGYYLPYSRHQAELHFDEKYTGTGGRYLGELPCINCDSYARDNNPQLSKRLSSFPRDMCQVCKNTGYLPKYYVKRHEDLKHAMDYSPACHGKSVTDKLYYFSHWHPRRPRPIESWLRIYGNPPM